MPRISNQTHSINVLGTYAHVFAALGDVERAARLLGAYWAHFTEAGFVIEPVSEEAWLQQTGLASARDTLGKERWEQAMQIGGARTLDEALTDAQQAGEKRLFGIKHGWGVLGKPSRYLWMVTSLCGGSGLFLAAGVLWAFRSVQGFTDPDFTDPGTLNDWVAVLSLSAAMLLLAAALTALPVHGLRRFLLRLTAGAAVVAGAANLAEDGLAWESAGAFYAGATMALVLALATSSVVFALRPPRWPAVVTAATLVGLLLLEKGGGLLVLAGWAFAAWSVQPLLVLGSHNVLRSGSPRKRGPTRIQASKDR